MRILFAIAVLSFAALVWAAVAIVRHIRRNSAMSNTETRGTPATADPL
jgi:hypothetical protein